jgi:hypothetical protein
MAELARHEEGKEYTWSTKVPEGKHIEVSGSNKAQRMSD